MTFALICGILFKVVNHRISLTEYGGVAHLVERYIRIVEVVSSSLIVSTIKATRVKRVAFYNNYFNLTVKVILFPLFSAHTLPECPSAMLRTRESPMPKPPVFAFLDLSAR